MGMQISVAILENIMEVPQIIKQSKINWLFKKMKKNLAYSEKTLKDNLHILAYLSHVIR